MQAGTLTGIRGLDRDVLIRLSYEDLLRACTTNVSLSRYCRDDDFWREFLVNKFPSITTKTFGSYTYPSWREYAEVIFTNARLITIPIGTVPTIIQRFANRALGMPNILFRELKEISQPYLKDAHARRGDIVEFEDLANPDLTRSYDTAKCIYNGVEIDELGHGWLSDATVPHQYKLNEFIDPSRWFTVSFGTKPISNNTVVYADFSDVNMYDIMNVQKKYLIVKTGNVYYTIVRQPTDFISRNWPSEYVRGSLAVGSGRYVYDIDGRITANPLYDEIRSSFKGYILVRVGLFTIL